jgi:hypothetical protein
LRTILKRDMDRITGLTPLLSCESKKGGKLLIKYPVNPVKKEIGNEAPAASCEARAGEGDINGRSSSH